MHVYGMFFHTQEHFTEAMRAIYSVSCDCVFCLTESGIKSLSNFQAIEQSRQKTNTVPFQKVDTCELQWNSSDVGPSEIGTQYITDISTKDN